MIDSPTSFWIVYLIIVGIIEVAYYTALEYFFHSSMGKWITKTRLNSKHELTFSRCFLRSCVRLIPIFMLMGKKSEDGDFIGFHDRISETRVIKVL